MTTRTYQYLNGPFTASFSDPETIAPEDAAAFLTEAVQCVGGAVTTGFDPDGQENRADIGFLAADIRIELPDGRRMWVSIECPTDEAM